jgi:hypothetical protein
MLRFAAHGLLALLLAAALIRCTSESSSSGEAETQQVDPEDAIPFDTEGTLAVVQEGDTAVTLQIEIAETDSARTRGMMQRTGFPDETSGMLFPFPEEAPRSFWMANTPVALDLLFINADSQIVSVAKYARPYSPESIASDAPAQYVLETPAGFADSYGVVEGDRVRWRRTDTNEADPEEATPEEATPEEATPEEATPDGEGQP